MFILCRLFLVFDVKAATEIHEYVCITPPGHICLAPSDLSLKSIKGTPRQPQTVTGAS